MNRYSFWVGTGHRNIPVWFRSAAGIALAGGCYSWCVRDSVRSFSGKVLWAFFSDRGKAASCGRCLASRVGRSIKIRPAVCSAAGEVWIVSIPVVN